MSSNPLKVLHITRTIDPIGGCEIYIRNLIEASPRYRIQPSLCVSVTSQTSPLPSSVPTDTVPNLAALRRHEAKAAVRELEALLQVRQPDLIHIHDLNNPFVLEYCGKRFPTVKTTLNADAYCGGIDKYLYRSKKACGYRLGVPCLAIAYYERCMSRHPKRALEIIGIKKQALEAIRFISQVAVPSEAAKQILIQNGVSPDKISVIPLFAHLPLNAPITSYPKESKEILFLGRLRPYKGVSYLLHALARMTQPFQADIIGDGEERSSLEALSKQLKLLPQVRFLGNLPHDDIVDHLNRAALLVVPSIYPDSFPTVGLEAMSRARPVIGFRIGGIPEWLEDTRTGFLVEPQDTQALAKKMEYLLANPVIAEQMGLEGKRRADLYFTEAPHMQTIGRFYARTAQSFSSVHTSAR